MMRTAAVVALLTALVLAPAALTSCASSTGPGSSTSANVRAKPEDIDLISGPIWTGTLTYRDYTTNQATTIRSALKVIRLPGDPPSWEFRIHYPDERDQSTNSTVRLLDAGRMLDDETVIERTRLSNASVRIVTEKDGEDNDKPARIRYVYIYGPRECSIQKLTRPHGERTYTERNIYQWTR